MFGSIMKVILSVAFIAAPCLAAPPPKEIIPPSVGMEAGELSRKFEKALYEQCRPGQCYAKGCTPISHEIVTKRGDVSLPGIYNGRGEDSLDTPQAYLTQAQCAYSFENTLDTKMIQDLDRRLTTILSAGFLAVKVSSQALPPSHEELKEPAKPTERSKAEIMQDELWHQFLPALPWLAGLLLAVLATMSLVWAFRRLGKESIEDKLLAKQLELEAQEAVKPETQDTHEVQEVDLQKKRTEKFGQHLGAFQTSPKLLQDIGKDWLERDRFHELSTAIKYFGAEGLKVVPDNPGAGQKRAALKEYYEKNHDSTELTDDFLRELDKILAEKRGLGQDPLATFRAVHDQFGPAQIAEIVEMMPLPSAALTLVLLPVRTVLDTVPALSKSLIKSLAQRLLVENRMSPSLYLQTRDWLNAVLEGRTPLGDSGLLANASGGSPLDVSVTLSALLSQLESGERREVFKSAIEQNRGITPHWAHAIFYPEMLDKIATEQRNNVLLEQDPDALAAWFQKLRNQPLRQRILSHAPTLLRENLNRAPRPTTADLSADALRGLTQSMQRRFDGGEVELEQVL